MSVDRLTHGALTAFGSTSGTVGLTGESRVGSGLPRGRGHRPAALCWLRRAAEAGLTMLMILLYAAGGLAIAVYMVAALLRPEKF
jgi:hypothetical protein